jgi:Fe-S-cluster containining protein
MNKDKSWIINGVRIDPGILRKDAVRRCGDIKCAAACCTDGVWLRAEEPSRILQWASEIKAFLPPDRHDESKWFEQGAEEKGTASVDDPARSGETCCIFLHPDRRCILQIISQEHNLGWPGLKPFYCAIYPLYTENDTLLMDDITPRNIRGAMCRHNSPPKQAIYKLFSEEAALVLGENGYKELCEKAGDSRSRKE